MVKHPKKLILSILLCELVGISGTPFTSSAIPTWYQTLNMPFFSPPNWIFGPVWTILYALMGVSLYQVWIVKGKSNTVSYALRVFGVQLFLNFAWSILFFGLRNPLFAFVEIVSLWIMIAYTMKVFYPLSKTAAYLLVPYILWVSFASILNLSIVLLN